MTATCALMWGPRVSRAQMVAADGPRHELPLARWRGLATAGERRVLEHAVGPVLDIGTGPGRFLQVLRSWGLDVLGVDDSIDAVERARALGRPAHLASVFDPLPREGRWGTVLLLDGTIGIGGDPVALLTRCRELLRPRGIALVELEEPSQHSYATRVRIESGAAHGPWFAWAWINVNDLAAAAADAGLWHVKSWEEEEQRWFALLRAP
ncbi:MAG: methyltransferase domain-containing protein [Nitriliruptorales bacterium]|nr:methyltransferase domain-containing protein [Nitriliruptorales bacterium]